MYVNLPPAIVAKLKKQIPSLESAKDLLTLQKKELTKEILKKYFNFSPESVKYNNAYVFIMDQMEHFNINTGITNEFILAIQNFTYILEQNNLCVRSIWMLPKLFDEEKVEDENLCVLEEKHPDIAKNYIGLYDLKTMKAAIPQKPYFRNCSEILLLFERGKNDNYRKK